MEKTIFKAFTFMFKEQDWKSKFFILALLSFPNYLAVYLAGKFSGLRIDNVPILLCFAIILSVIVVVTLLFIEGYCNKCSQKVINMAENTEGLLPQWKNNFWCFFKIGFSFYVAIFIALAAVMGVVFFAATASSVAKLIWPVIILCVLTLLIIFLYAFCYVALRANFCTNFKVSSMFAFKKAKKIIFYDFFHYLSVAIIILSLSIALGDFLQATEACPYIFLLLSPIINAYIFLVFAYLRGTLFPVPAQEFFEPTKTENDSLTLTDP